MHFFLNLFLVGAICAIVPKVHCGFYKIGTYDFSATKTKTFYLAGSSAECSKNFGEFIVIETADESSFLMNALNNNATLGHSLIDAGGFSATDYFDKDDWYWSNGQPINPDVLAPSYRSINDNPYFYLWIHKFGTNTNWHPLPGSVTFGACPLMGTMCQKVEDKVVVTTPKPITGIEFGTFTDSATGIKKKYIFEPNLQSPYVSQSSCSLLNINSKAEESYLMYRIAINSLFGTEKEFYIGGVKNNGQWVWKQSNAAISFGMQWRTYQPDNYGGQENCMTISKGNDEMGINDSNCGYSNFGFICQQIV